MEFNELRKEYNKIFQEYEKEVNRQLLTSRSADVQKEKTELNTLYEKLRSASENEQVYFEGAQLSLYKDYLNKRIENRKKEKSNFSIYTSLKKEFEYQRRKLFTIPEAFRPLSKENIQDYKDTLIVRLEYLKMRLYEMGIDVKTTYSEFGRTEISFNENLERRLQYEKSQLSKEFGQFQEFDLKDSKANEKIIYLNQLGIIQFLQTREALGISTNAIATALSAITGEKKETIQSYINPILNPDSGQKNNPLNSRKNLEKVNQTLLSLGFKPQK